MYNTLIIFKGRKMAKVFIDGAAGTTGLKISDRLSERKDIDIITLADDMRKDESARAEVMSKADVVFLCLPDEAAVKAAALADGTVIIDTSTAHRTAPGWVYGMPELEGQREKIKNSRKIANPGCHASGFIALVAPLVSAGLLDKDGDYGCFSMTGYSGGGKKMIAEYESDNRASALDSPRQYGLTQYHKHLPEMQKICGLSKAPVFCPTVAPYYSGMQVSVPVFDCDTEAVKKLYSEIYADGLIRYRDVSENGFIASNALSGTDGMCVYVYGNGERAVLVSVFDNLGKGASGAAIQNMNIILNVKETEGLII